ncbi:hypothetical protein ACFL0M_00685 [Thermodesulfobacteriota bacterium]
MKEALAAAIHLKITGDARAIWPDEFWQDEFFELVALDEKWK